MSVQQSLLDWVRILNKYATNKLLIHISGKKFGHFAILCHVGRKTGKVYRIPIIAEPMENAFVIALTYGKKVNWLSNVLARGSCSLVWKNIEYTLHTPTFIDKAVGLTAFPPFFQMGLKMMGVQYYLKLSGSG